MKALSAEKILRWLGDASYFGVGACLNYASSCLLKRNTTVTAPGYGRIRIRADQSDFAVIRQILKSREYDAGSPIHHAWLQERYDGICASGGTPVIIDAGANIGVSARWFAKQYPKAKVIAVEPDPDNFALCNVNTLGFGNIVSVHAAIGARAGAVFLTNTTGHAWGVQTRRTEGTSEGAMPVRPISTLLDPNADERLLLVKIDIEGFERDLFSDNVEWIETPALIIIEPHDWMFPGEGSSASFQKALAKYDWELLIKGENLFYFRLPERAKRHDESQTAKGNGSPVSAGNCRVRKLKRVGVA